jgi:Flp pilus assembly protein TadD
VLQEEGWVQAIFQNRRPALETSNAAIKGAKGYKTQLLAAAALALAGENKKAEEIAHEWEAARPDDTRVQAVSVPLVQAGIALNGGNGGRAIELLNAAAPYDRANISILYVRGFSYLKAGRGAEAQLEFRKILALQEFAPTNPAIALARLGLARAQAMQGDAEKARTAYRDFFTLWKNADSDIPILKEAKTEYAKLR